MFFIRKPDYASFDYVTISLHSLVMSNLPHLDVVIFCTKNLGHKMVSRGINPV